MGGSGGGGISYSHLKQLEAKAKKSLQDAASSEGRHVFISFAHEDLNDVNLLRGQAKNEKSDLVFDDYSVKEPFDSENADYIRQKIREKIERTSVTVVYLTKDSASSSWVNWEIKESIKLGKGVVGMYKGDNPPSKLPAAIVDSGCKVVNWSHEELTKAIEHACKNR